MTGEAYPASDDPFVLCDLQLELNGISDTMQDMLSEGGGFDLRFCFTGITMTNSNGVQ